MRTGIFFVQFLSGFRARILAGFSPPGRTGQRRISRSRAGLMWKDIVHREVAASPSQSLIFNQRCHQFLLHLKNARRRFEHDGGDHPWVSALKRGIDLPQSIEKRRGNRHRHTSHLNGVAKGAETLFQAIQRFL